MPGFWRAEVQLAVACKIIWTGLPESTMVAAGLLASEGARHEINEREGALHSPLIGSAWMNWVLGCMGVLLWTTDPDGTPLSSFTLHFSGSRSRSDCTVLTMFSCNFHNQLCKFGGCAALVRGHYIVCDFVCFSSDQLWDCRIPASPYSPQHRNLSGSLWPLSSSAQLGQATHKTIFSQHSAICTKKTIWLEQWQAVYAFVSQDKKAQTGWSPKYL